MCVGGEGGGLEVREGGQLVICLGVLGGGFWGFVEGFVGMMCFIEC